MVFTTDDYTYVPPELMEDVYEADVESGDMLEHRHEAGSGGGKWEWGPGGKNLPPYNAWYYKTHEEEIKAQRARHEAEARGHGATSNATIDENVAKLQADLEKERQNKAKWREEHVDEKWQKEKLEAEKIGRERRAKEAKEEEKRKKEAAKNADKKDSSSKDDDEKSKKKKGSSGSGSKGSSKKASTKSDAIKQQTSFGKGGKAKELFPGTKGSGSSKGSGGGKGSSASKKEKEKDKEDGPKTIKVTMKSYAKDEERRSIPEEKVRADALSNVKVDSSAEQNAENNYAVFLSQLSANGYTPKNSDEGLELWKMFRAAKGSYTSDKELEEEKKKLQHGMDTFEDAVLEHHGILGQKWYVKNGPPYPLDAEDHNASEKKAGWEKSLSSGAKKAAAGAKKAYETAKPYAKKAGEATVKAGKATVEAAKNAKAKRKERKAAKEEADRQSRIEQYNTQKRNAIMDGDSKYAREHFNELSDQEVNELLSRLDLSKKVDKANHVMTTEEKIDQLMGRVAKGKDWVDKGSNAWNSVAKIYNTMNGDDPLPVIGENYEQTKRNIATRQRTEYINSLVGNTDALEKNINNFTPAELNTLQKALSDRQKILNSIDPDTTNSDGSKTIASLQSQLSDMQKEIEELKKKGE